jgi:hypothetical protein
MHVAIELSKACLHFEDKNDCALLAATHFKDWLGWVRFGIGTAVELFLLAIVHVATII